MENPLERGKGHGIVGSAEFLERVKERFLSGQPPSREVPAIRKVIGQVEPEKILVAVAAEFQVSREDLLQRGNRGIARPVLMEFLYRYGGLNQREIGELLGIDYSSVSVGRRKLQTLLGKDKGPAARIGEIKKILIQE
jgi:chromosomal replication initiation ATPase DnaA